MAIQPTILCIHASDAPQHTGELKTILLRMKTENRISDFKAIDISITTDFSFDGEDPQGIIVLLTHGIEQIRKKIEQQVMTMNHADGVRLIEIIVDNLPYHNRFISFPQDLKPIRTRDDMNLAWANIEKNLQELFPEHTVKVSEPPIDPVKVIKPIGISIAAFTFNFLKSLGAIILYFFLSLIFWIGFYTQLFTDWNGVNWEFFWPLVVVTIVALMIYRHRRKQAKRKSLRESSS